MKLLDKIQDINDIKNLNDEELIVLSKEIRTVILDAVSHNGGHLASNLGVVELTIALLKTFDFNHDKIIFDVGHQSYVYKILTGRLNDFKTLRKHHGISGYPKREESPYDFFNTGHSGNSISAGIGMARARDLIGDDYHVISLIGDGSFTNGMVYEALNDLGYRNSKMLIILNDNGMSITKNVGGFSNWLNKVRLTPSYNKLKNKIRKGKSNFLIRIGRKIKNSFKNLIYKPMFFESLGVRYLGPIDGHNLKSLITTLEHIKNINEPILLHVVTKKGYGYDKALENPEKYHATSKFDLQTGVIDNKNNDTYSNAFGLSLANIAKKDDKVVAISAAMITGTGLKIMQEKFPKRVFDVGIAEAHATTLASGMALGGLKPVFAVYSSFLNRGFDQIVMDICMQKLPVVFAIDRAGLVGSDGATHHGVFDLSYLSSIPNLEIITPKCTEEMPVFLKYALDIKRPIAIRYPRGGDIIKLPPLKEVKTGTWEEISKGEKIVILATGKMVEYALLAKNKLSNINPIVVNAYFIKPLDKNYLKKIVKNKLKVITIEDNNIKGGFGSSVLLELSKLNFREKIKIMGYQDHFINHGEIPELLSDEHLDVDSIVKAIKKINSN